MKKFEPGNRKTEVIIGGKNVPEKDLKRHGININNPNKPLAESGSVIKDSISINKQMSYGNFFGPADDVIAALDKQNEAEESQTNSTSRSAKR